MNINSKLLTFNTLTISVLVSDNNDAPFPKFVNYFKSSAYLSYSPFLTFEHKSDADGKVIINRKKLDGDKYENATFSILDYSNVKKTFKEIDNIISSDYYEMVEHIDKGIIPTLKDEYQGFKRTLTNSTGKGQIAFTLCFTYKRKEDLYTPCVKILINTNDSALNIPIDKFSSIALVIEELNLHSAARESIAAFLANHNLKKTNIMASSKQVEIEENE